MKVEYINLPLGLAFLTDGATLPITKLFDVCGEETTDPVEAVSFTCGAGQLWITDRIDSFVRSAVH